MSIVRKDIDLGDTTFLLNQVFCGCIPRESEVDHHIVQAKPDLFRRITTTEVTVEKKAQVQISLNGSQRGWNHML